MTVDSELPADHDDDLTEATLDASDAASPLAATTADGPAPSRTRVAILGGGQAGLTVALQLTDPANPNHDQYDVTVHQLGWRLGGKGATGRPTAEPWAAARIEEHGLHNWFGFYDNAFSQMRTVYAELNRPANCPLATFDEAFVPANEAVFVECIEGQPDLWAIHNLTNTQEPGVGGLFLSPFTYVEMAIELVERLVGGLPEAGTTGLPILLQAQAAIERAAAAAGSDFGVSVATLPQAIATARSLAAELEQGPAGSVSPAVGLVERARTSGIAADSAVSGPPWIDSLSTAAARAVCWVLWVFMTALWEVVRTDIETVAHDVERRAWIGANLVYACVVGVLRDGVIDSGFDVINDRDFRSWLTDHLYDDGGVALRSPIIEAIYTASFAYPEGNAEIPPGQDWPPAENMEAGTALRGLVRTAFTYKGSFAYRFAAGTADTCYAPIYQVLVNRGVGFEFFHRVTGLELEGSTVASISIAQQAQIVPSAPGYDPLMDVAGLPCWPDEPLWEQLLDGGWFQAAGADFENPTPAIMVRETPLTLTAGRDYDVVVVAVPIGVLPSIAGQIIAARPAWATAVEAVKTVATQALQIWWTQPTDRMGLAIPRPPIVTWLYDSWSPLNVWGDYPELIPMEGWPAGANPLGLGYFCSTMPDGPDPSDPYPDQTSANAIVRTNAVELLGDGIASVLPNVTRGGSVDWDLLFDPRPAPGTGSDRIDAQYYRANVTASERYALSVVGSSAQRLAVHDPALPNVFLAGDWTACTINAGCMEAATMSGMLCANAISGYPARADIVGVEF